MLSICIPVFNYDVSILVEELHVQLLPESFPYEIVVIDDASHEKYRKINKTAVAKKKYIQLEKNIGRAKIRNKFLDFTKYDFLLFIDNDSRICLDNYIKTYIETIKTAKYEIVFGGRVFGEKPKKRKHILRWKYGVKRESKSAQNRNLFPNQSFMTNNFIIHRSLFEKVKFNENLIEYGHEDTLFGYELNKHGIRIKHIENTVLNGDYETNDRYLIKTEKALLNLIYMLKYCNDDPRFINDVSLLKFHKHLSLLKLDWIIRLLFVLKRPFIRYLLSKGCANMYLFSFYKLGFFMVNNK